MLECHFLANAFALYRDGPFKVFSGIALLTVTDHDRVEKSIIEWGVGEAVSNMGIDVLVAV